MGNRRGRRGSDRRRDTASADNAPDITAPADNAPGISCMGSDQRNWVMLKITGSGIPENDQPYVVTMIVGCKPVQLVQQEADLIVYVNPELRGCDDWESPPGSGRIFRVGTPERVLQEYVAEAAAIAEFIGNGRLILCIKHVYY